MKEVHKFCSHCGRTTLHFCTVCPACGSQFDFCALHRYQFFAVWDGKFDFLCPHCGEQNPDAVQQASAILDALRSLAKWASNIAAGGSLKF